FVEKVLKGAEEKLERKYKFEAQGYDFNWVVRHVAQLLGMEPSESAMRGQKIVAEKGLSLLEKINL
ncbi:MAG: hypothetical protein JW883_10155, partial [Deltaproteobacteria bacterium]|nr:hypothetical protein [Deltaproteobacteria bacterium]